MLYIVPTPIGNLKDITLRAIDTLKSVSLILAEDTRKSHILFKTYSITTPSSSFHMFNEKSQESYIISRLLNNEDIAIISDAGTPGICDPGVSLIQACRAKNIPITALPGACAITTALSLYGSSDPFQFIGFLEKKGHKQWIDILYYPGISICYETPHHLQKTLLWLSKHANDHRIFLAKELTKIYEETFEDTPSALLKHFETRKILGEYVCIIPGHKNPYSLSPKALTEYLHIHFEITKKEAIVAAAKLLNTPKNKVYNAVHNPGS